MGGRKSDFTYLVSVLSVIILLVILSQLILLTPLSVNTSLEDQSMDREKLFTETQTIDGNGTEEDPYIIENQEFHLENWKTLKIITDTDDYYIIRNCQFIATIHSRVRIFNSTNSIVENCEFTKSALSVHSSRNSIVRGCTFRDVDWIGTSGLSIYYSVNCTVIDNTVYGCFTGIQVTVSNDTFVSHNIIYDNIYGIEFFFAAGTIFQDNQLYNDELHIRLDGITTSQRSFYWYQYIGAKLVCNGNYVNNKPLVFYQDLTSGSIDASDYGQLILQNCSNIAVRNGLLSNITYGMQFLFCSEILIRDVVVTNYSRTGIDIFHTNSSSIVNCSISGEDWWGLRAQYCWNITVEGSYFEGNLMGLYLGFCNNCTISNNTATGNDKGLYLSNSHNSTFIGNSLLQNDAGIFFYDSCQNLVVNNSILYNTQYGIYLDRNSQYNRFFGNSIGWNGRFNAYSESTNYFDDGKNTGNLWSDYDGHGVYEIYFRGEDNYPSILYPSSFVVATLTILLASVLIAVLLIGFIRIITKIRSSQT